MTRTTFISAIALASVLGFTAPSYAQDTHMIGGKAVPAGQVEAVQAKCDELRAAGTADAAASTDAAAGTDASASTDAAAGAETATDTATDAAAGTDAAAPADATAEAEIDLATLTIEMCDEGGFTASTP